MAYYVAVLEGGLMAVRIGLGYFSLLHMQEMFGSRDGTLIERFTGGTRPDCVSIIRRCIEEGAPFPDLDVEGDSHIQAAQTIAEAQPGFAWSRHFGYNCSAVRDAVREFQGKVPRRAHELLKFLQKGRPLFGRAMNGDSQFYSYLTVNEIAELRQALQPFFLPAPGSDAWEDFPWEVTDGIDIDFMNEFAPTLEEAHAGGSDIWIFAS